MISMEEIESTILDLEKRDTTYAVCERLAWLYIVRDHLSEAPRMASERISVSGSDFLRAVDGKPYTAVLGVIDEHMEAVKAICPKEYEAVLQMISEL